MDTAKYRIEVFYKTHDPRCVVIQEKLKNIGHIVEKTFFSDNYLVNEELSATEIQQAAELLIHPVIQHYSINEPYIPADFDYAIEIGYLPGVTDNIAHTVRESIEDMLKRSIDIEKSVFSTNTYFFKGIPDLASAEKIGAELHNPLIQRMKILDSDSYKKEKGMGNTIPIVHIHETPVADEVNLDIAEDELMTIAKEGIKDNDGSRRGPLALDSLSMHVIRDYFIEQEKRNPTDIELESIAQTWSEHCKHTIFAAEIDEINEGIYKRYIKEATIRIRREKGDKDFCLSVFEDNSGGIEFDDNWIISDKVETHNSPSALDPFGGAITGIVGVNRDAIGFGYGAKPVANRYGFCFADPFDDKPLYRTKEKDSKLLSPRRIMEGVIHGVNAGGNTSGIPTPQGFVYFDDRFKGKPLVFVGTVGLMPKNINGKSSVQKRAMPGDNIVMIGGRVGRDGIHGATFSSEALNSGSPATAVQIGDPITQKKLSDAVVKEARDRGLYNSITDNGAGGLSCSVAEMARECGGFEVQLEKVPLKYPGLSPWQIWVSESQERMTLSVPDDKLEEFLSLMEIRGVESSVIGKFNDGNRAEVYLNGEKIYDLDMHFLHEGLPQKQLKTTYNKEKLDYPSFTEPDMNAVFHSMLEELNNTSFAFISTQYDHEVQANSVIKPLQGKGKVNGNASVIRPLLDSSKGVVLSQGLYPTYSDIDTYWMAACSIDTAIRNAISAGGTLEHMAILDNFCWCDSNNPERLGQLKEAARGCYETAVAYGTPFISGKDSMFNDFKGYDENFNECNISIPPTLLISSIGVVEDINICQTIDFKYENDLLYVIGTTADELGGSEYLALMGKKISGEKYTGNSIPQVDAELFSKNYRAYEQAVRQGLIASAISIERGGLATALAKASLAGLRGVSVELNKLPAANITRNDTLLYSESQGRLLVSVAPGNKQAFEKLCSEIPCACIGTVRGDSIIIKGLDGKEIISTSIATAMNSYTKTFKDF